MRPLLSLVVACAVLGTVVPLAQAPHAEPPFPRPAAKYEVDIEKDVMVPMRDGVRLATDIYRPRGVDGPLPTILIRLPYNKNSYGGATTPARFFAGHGYAVVLQDVRGKFGSEGAYRVYEGDVTDWPDAFDWIGRQPWSTKKIGTYGCSYLGEGQIIAMAQRHPLHAAAIPQAAGGNVGRVPGRRIFWGSVEGGAMALSINFGWMPMFASVDKGARPLPKVDFAQHFKTLPTIDMTDRAGSPSWDWRNFLERSPDDPWWDRQGYLTAAASTATPALHVSTWFDLAAEALQEAEIFSKNATTPEARTGQYAIIGPNTHCANEGSTSATVVGELNVGDARRRYAETYLRWFDFWLKGEQNGVLDLPRYQYYVIGRNAWHASPVWPVAGMRETPMYFASDGRANTAAGNGRLQHTPPRGAASDAFTYDPMDPVPARGGSICCTGNPKDQPGSFDHRDLESRPDLLVYSTPPLTTGLEITGPLRAEIHVSSDVRDTDVTVKVLDVFPDGRSMNVVEGITRVRYRDGFGTPRLMEKGQVYRVPVDLHATSWYLPPGHRLRVHVSSSNFPRFDRNLNTGGKNYDETSGVVAHTTIHHSARYPSRILLPIVSGK